MKKNFLLSIFILSYYVNFGQDSILFTMHFQPDHLYDLSISQKTHLELSYAGDDSTLKALTDKGVKNPTVNERVNNIDAVYTTGNLGANGKMALQIEFANASDDLKGTMIYGTVDPDKSPVLDSIYSPRLDPQIKQQLLATIQNLYAQISYPNKNMAIGDEYSKTTPLSIPLGDNNLQMDLVQTYKLLSISPDSANFDVKVKYTMNMDLNNLTTVGGGGDGSGILVFDRKNKFLSRDELQYTMHLSAKYGKIDINAVLAGNSKTQCFISKR
jgi:hypothetical protein